MPADGSAREVQVTRNGGWRSRESFDGKTLYYQKFDLPGLFRMPVDLKIDTDGKTEEKRIEVVGTNSPFTVETFGRPRRIAVDPDHRVLTNSSDVKLRSSILRGQALQQQGDLSGALAEFNKALDLNKNSSLAHYRIAEVFYLQRNYQSAANEYRESISGVQEPRWT